MNTARVIYHLARADFLERIRRYSFLVTLGLTVFLGYQVAIGNLTVRLGSYRGEFNSAWVGSMMTLISTFFIGWFGFYLVKGPVARDRQTGVGQIIATTPISRSLYMAGKWASNFSVLLAMNVVLAVAGIGIQFLAGESNLLDLPALFAPFLFVALPVMALIAALALLFESIGFLSGGFGNTLYFFLFAMTIPLGIQLSATDPALEPLGMGLFQSSMGAAAEAAFPNYDGGFVIGATGLADDLGIDLEPADTTFPWTGVTWTGEIILKRLALFALALVITLVAALFFDRFDPSRHKPGRTRAGRKKAAALVDGPPAPPAAAAPAAALPVHLTALSAPATHYPLARVLVSELKLLLKGLPWWWYAVAGGLILAGIANPPETGRAYILPFAWLWPVLVWSGLGSRENRHNTAQMVFSAARPLWRQLPAAWLAGLLVAILAGSGVALRLAAGGDFGGLLAWVSGAVFIPSLALACGVWSGSNKLFEVLYVSLWYLGPMNRVAAVDFPGAGSSGNLAFFLPFSAVLIVLAFVGRARQVT